MKHSIDTDFSVYELLVKDSSQNIFSYQARMLQHWSSNIEQTIICQQVSTSIFVGFQQLKLFIPQIPIYTQLSQVAAEIWIFGLPCDRLPQIENIYYIPLKTNHQLCQEWFVIAHHDTYSRALVARQTTPYNFQSTKRSFEGAITFDRTVIRSIYQKLVQLITSI